MPIVQAHCQSGYMETTVSPAGMGLPKRTPVTAAVRSYDHFWGLFNNVLWWRIAGRKVERARLSAMRLGMHGRALYTASSALASHLRAGNHLRADTHERVQHDEEVRRGTVDMVCGLESVEGCRCRRVAIQTHISSVENQSTPPQQYLCARAI